MKYSRPKYNKMKLLCKTGGGGGGCHRLNAMCSTARNRRDENVCLFFYHRKIDRQNECVLR